MLKIQGNHLSVLKDCYYTYQKHIKLATNISVTNKNLYQEFEYACKKQNGILTYAEYLALDQFGKHGFYATSSKHGKTDIDYRWGKALANYCCKNGYSRIIEFGCGTGELGIATSKAFKRLTGHSLKWIGIELDKSIHEKILENFKTNNMGNSVETIVASIDELPTNKNALIVFPYSLDSIPPHVFLNTELHKSYPNALLGLTFANGMLSEALIPPETLQKKGMKLEHGIFTQNNFVYNLSAWKLRRGQRAYLSNNAYSTLYCFTKKFTESSLIIIDEFREEHWNFNLKNLGTPKSLYEKNLICHDRKRYYHESGKHNLYFPLYRVSILKFLSQIGYRAIECDIEQKKAAELNDTHWYSLRKNYATYAFIAKKNVEKKITTLTIPSPQKKIV
jgi:hypothetical protein